MKKSMQVRGVNIGEGIPKICVPVTGGDIMCLLDEVAAVKDAADLVEWRADYFQEPFEEDRLMVALNILRGALGDTPLVFCYRTEAEGGKGALRGEEYAKLCEDATASGCVDLLDIELSAGDVLCERLVGILHKYHVLSVLSHHDFQVTPPENELLSILRRTQSLSADIPKLAVMARSSGDVMRLLQATHQYVENFATGPVITVAMGQMGAISRVWGEFFGSDITFGRLQSTTAPGQIEATKLKEILELLHESR